MDIPPSDPYPPAAQSSPSFFWFQVDRVNFADMFLPYIVKKNVKHVSLKMAETEMLRRFVSFDYFRELRDYKRLQLLAFYCTEAECELFDDINFNHCMGKFGPAAHKRIHCTITLESFMKLYEIVKRTCRTKDGQILVGSNFASVSNSARDTITPDIDIRNSTNPVEQHLNGYVVKREDVVK